MSKKITKNDLKDLFLQDKDMIKILDIISSLPLQDVWLAAGAVRNLIWNHLSGKPGFDYDTDIDLIFFDPDMSYEDSLKMEEKVNHRYPDYQWQVKNQCHMHKHNPMTAPYQSACDAVSKYPETCTAIAIRLCQNDLEIYAPYGFDAILSFECHPTPYFLANQERMLVYKKRFMQKNWSAKWPKITYFED